MKKLIPQTIKNLYHLKMAILANLWYGFPSRKIKVIGVTGTNGKTTTCQMIAKILEEAGHKVAMISTINFKITEKEWVNDTKYTTLSSFKVQKFIKRAIAAGCDYLVLEISSHSLDQFRTWGINYQTAVITNVTREHLDYHRTMDEYRRAKLKLFRKAETAVVNLDMENPEDFLMLKNNKSFLYSIKYDVSSIKYKNLSDKFKNLKLISPTDIKSDIHNTSYKIHDTLFKINLPGLFNIENALAAVCVGLSEGISFEKISQALSKIQGVPGRLEFVPNDKNLNIIIDYAVTPDSLSKLYTLIQQINTNKTKVISVFGACGERDRGKRPIMGEIVSRYADHIIVTNEDPYHEDPQNIINEVFEGVSNPKSKTLNPKQIPNSKIQNTSYMIHDAKTESVNAWRILDRRDAIKKALQIARSGDFVVVTGKGAEETMAMGNKRIPWNDRKVILGILRELK